MERRDGMNRSASRQVIVVQRAWRAIVAVATLVLLVAYGASPAQAATPLAPGTCSASFVATSFGSAAASVSGARITLSTASAVSGSRIVVRGTGWPAKAQIVIGINHVVQADGFVNAFDGVSTATATSSGTFTAPAFTMPTGRCGAQLRAGSVATIVAHTPDYKPSVSAPLSIAQTPAITVPLDSSNITPGTTTIPVHGSDWSPGSAVSLVAATDDPNCSRATVYDLARCVAALPDAKTVVARADSRGRFGVSVPLPLAMQPGVSVTVRAAISSPPYGDLVFHSAWYGVIPLTVTPTLTLDRQIGPPGATIALRGDHWPAGKSVIVEYCRSEAVSQSQNGKECNQGALGLVVAGYAQELGEADVDTLGHFSARVTLPANARPGSVMLQARVKVTTSADSLYSIYIQTASFNVAKVSSVAPVQMTAPWWPFAAAGTVLAVVLGLVFWRRRAGRLRSAN